MIQLELTNLECSADYDRLIGWYTTFYSHTIITQGYTNKGQWLGAGIGTGGNSQYLGFTLYHNNGALTLFGQRRNPDLDYTMYIDSKKFEYGSGTAETNIKDILDFGIKSTYYIRGKTCINTGIIFEDIHNPLNRSQNNGNSFKSEIMYNFSLIFGIKYNF